MISFELTEEQEKTLNEWKSTQEFPPATIGGAYTYEFTPTGLGTIIVVKCVNKNTIDLTDYDNW
jgi:hypothetical protein